MSGAFSFRGATADDAQRIAANSLRAYPVPGFGLEARVQRALEGPYPVEQMFLVERDGELVGQARTIDYRCWYGGVEVPVGGLASVAVAPEARRSGVAAAIVRHHVAQCRALGWPWSLLYPFAPTFYAAHGWGPSSRRLRWRFRPAALPLFPERREVRRQPALAALQACYAAHCRRTSGSLSRSERAFRFEFEPPSDSKHVVGVGGDDALRGYLVYQPVAPTLTPQTLVVRELVALDDAAERALLGFVAAQGDQFAVALLDTPVEHPLAALLDNPQPELEDELMPPEHHPLATLYSGLMARIVDLAGALRGRGYPGRSGSLAVTLTEDRLVPENRRTVTLRVEDGVAAVSEGEAAAAARVAGPVGALSSILSGGVGLAAAARGGLVEAAGDVASADALLALPVPYPLVYF